MGLRINTNIAGLNAARTLRNSSLKLNVSLERLSSGLRINRAKDDAAGLAIAEAFQAQVRGLRQSQRNVQDGISMVQTADGALGETINILQRMRELAVQGTNGTNDANAVTAIEAEIIQLVSQIDDIANNTKFNGNVLINGSGTSMTIQAGADAGQTLAVDLTGIDATAATLSVNYTAATFTTANDFSAEITAIDAAIDTVALDRATLGGIQNRLEFTISNLAIQEENQTASESFIRDADIARESLDFTRNQILLSAGTSILAQANVVPQTALQLLG